MKIEHGGRTVIGVDDLSVFAEIDPILDGFWITLGAIGNQGLNVDSNEWDSFVKLVNEANEYVKQNYQ